MALALTIGLLTAGAVYLLLQRDYLRVILGFVVLSHAANLILFSSGGIQRRGEPLGEAPDPAVTADALPQAFVLTAIVIAFAITIYMLALSVTRSAPEGADVEPDPVDPGRPEPGEPPAHDDGTPAQHDDPEHEGVQR